MNFFDAQDRARRATRWLVVVYILATLLIVAGVTAVTAAAFGMLGETGQPADPAVLVTVAALAALLIIAATVFKTARLSSGGGRVASDMGGTLVSAEVADPLRRRLRNVVEEMAIASGVPVPEIYVLENEKAINAFAAGFTPDDAAIAVTRGTLETLNRGELQGVIAHEFSHILNGDMRLNIRMMGVLFGIMVIGMIGRSILRAGRYSSIGSSRRSKNSGAIVIIGLGLALLGWIGVFGARLVKAAVSRQREFLADASAVQFTRQTDGIANALKKIGGYRAHSYIRSADPEEISHMLFAGGSSRLTSLFATHPPLVERIRALDPGFNESEYPVVDVGSLESRSGIDTEDVPVSGFISADGKAAMPESITDSVGHPDAAQIAFAAGIRRSIPAGLYDAAHSPELAWLLVVALILAKDARLSARQLHFVDEQLGAERGNLVRRFAERIGEIGNAYRLPLLEVAFPALKQRPVQQQEFLLQLVGRLIELDGDIDLYEYCFYRVLSSSFEKAMQPSRRHRVQRAGKKAIRQAALDLLKVVAHEGHSAQERRKSAYHAGVAEFGEWARDAKYDDSGLRTLPMLDRSMNMLARMNSAGKTNLLEALGKTVSHDKEVTVTEAELLRTICASLDCPLPPILARSTTG